MKDLYSKEEVIELLNVQKHLCASTLGQSSNVFVYPKDFQAIKEWIMKAPLATDCKDSLKESLPFME